MQQTFDQRWQIIRAHLRKHADRLEHDAGMDGCMHDGGASVLRDRITVFEAGLARVIPDEWERIVAPLMDPEFAEYQRLRAKFERR